MLKCNYHTHTNRCMHAQGEDEDFVIAAVEAGYDVLGFADHSPWPYESGFVSGMRMTVAGLPQYIASLRSLEHRYSDKLKILVGLECEYFPAYINWLREAKEEYKLDYVILGNHHDTSDETGPTFGWEIYPDQIKRYVKMTTEGMRTGLYTYLAHPDLFLLKRKEFTPECRDACVELCRTALDMNMPVEYNLQGLINKAHFPDCIGYPATPFWEIAAEMGCKAVIGVDAHRPASLTNADYQAVRSTLENWGVQVLESLPLEAKE